MEYLNYRNRIKLNMVYNNNSICANINDESFYKNPNDNLYWEGFKVAINILLYYNFLIYMIILILLNIIVKKRNEIKVTSFFNQKD